MTRPVKLNAAVKLKAASPDAPKRRRFSIVAYTGGGLLVDAYDVPIYIDFDGLYWNSSRRPALYAHDPDKNSLVGQLDDIRIQDGQLLVDGFFLQATAVGREVQAIAEDGYEWQASVGADPHAEELEEVHEGQTATVNGRTAAGPCLISRRTCLGEVSFVVMGADDRTSARITARLSRARRIRGQGSPAMDEDFKEFLASLKFKAEDLTEEQVTALRAKFDEESPDTVDAGDDDEPLEGEGEEEPVNGEGEDEPVTGEDDPEKPVTSRRTSAGRRRPQVQANHRPKPRTISAAAAKRARELQYIAAIEKACKGHPRIEAKALKMGWNVDRAKLEVLRASRAGAPHPHRGGSGKINAKVIEAALLLTAGTPEDKVGKQFDQQTMNQALERDMRGASLHYIMDRVIEASGESFRGNRKSDSFINAALRAERSIRASGGFSTLSLGSILENVAHKALLAAYEAVETVWNQFCAVRSHNDFKVHSRYRLDAQGAFRKVGPDGELKNVGLSDAKFTNQLETFGAIISLTRQMQYNDDLGAFLELPKMLGTMGALAVEEAFFLLLLANANNFFHASNRNVSSGAFGIPSVTALEGVFRDQIGPNKKPVLISPVKMLVPTPIKVDADNLFEEVTVNETTTTDKAKPAKNPHKGKYKPFTSPYLNNTNIRVLDGNDQPQAIPGQSSTAFYLFADPASRAAFGMSFLNGIQQPTVQSDETAFNTLGLQWRAFFDFGCGQEDPVAAARSSGT